MLNCIPQADWIIVIASFKVKSYMSACLRSDTNRTIASIYISWVLKAILSSLMASLGRVAYNTGGSEGQIVCFVSGAPYLAIFGFLVL